MPHFTFTDYSLAERFRPDQDPQTNYTGLTAADEDTHEAVLDAILQAEDWDAYDVLQFSEADDDTADLTYTGAGGVRVRDLQTFGKDG